MSANVKKILVVRLKDENSGINKYRILDPHVKLQQLYADNYHIDIVMDGELMDMEKIKGYDAVFYHITLEQVEKIAEQTAKIKATGVKLILDIDDYWKYHPEHTYFKLAIKIKLAEKSIAALRKADIITTTTDHFADKIRQYNKNVFCIPNGINFKEKQFQIRERENVEKLNIGYVAGSSHLTDIKLLRGALTSLKRNRRPTQMRLCGFNTTKEKGLNSTWHKMEKEFTDNYNLDARYVEYLHEFVPNQYFNLSEMPYQRIWTEPINKYMTIYDELDLCLAPLKNIDFNSYKSNLKMLEAGAKKKPIIVSGVVPYQTFGIHEKNCLIVEANKEHKHWIKYINELVENDDMRTNLAESLYEMVFTQFNIDNITKLRHEIYQNQL